METTSMQSNQETLEAAASKPSDNPEKIFELFSIESKPHEYKEVEILTTVSPDFDIHVKSN